MYRALHDGVGVAQRYPAAGGWVELTYPELTARVKAMARGLIDLGVGPGDRVAILSRTRAEWTQADLAILFTGATAALRGSANFAAFAGAKHALRALAQSMARELGPLGVHVAHVVVDGAIDTAFIGTTFPERYALKEQGGILDPDHIAENYWHLHMQPRDAWTFELDLRPYMERW